RALLPVAALFRSPFAGGGPRTCPRLRRGLARDGALPVVRHDERLLLDHADVVAERVADREVDAVRPLLRLLADRHALGPQLLAQPAGVVGREADGEARGALRHQLADLLGGVGVDAGRRHELEEDLAFGLTLGTHGQPPHGSEVDVGRDLEAQLADVEVESFFLVEDPDVGDVYALYHLVASVASGLSAPAAVGSL